jgi:hypothetical protein
MVPEIPTATTNPGIRTKAGMTPDLLTLSLARMLVP